MCLLYVEKWAFDKHCDWAFQFRPSASNRGSVSGTKAVSNLALGRVRLGFLLFFQPLFHHIWVMPKPLERRLLNCSFPYVAFHCTVGSPDYPTFSTHFSQLSCLVLALLYRLLVYPRWCLRDVPSERFCRGLSFGKRPRSAFFVFDHWNAYYKDYPLVGAEHHPLLDALSPR